MRYERVDVAANRAAVKWSLGENLARVLWALCQPLFRWSPRIFWGWRRSILRLFRAEVGREAQVFPTARIFMPWNLRLGDECAVGDGVTLYALGRIDIGSRSTVSQGAHLCAGTHDISRPDRPLLKLPIRVGDDAWVCAEAFIAPGVVIGERSIVAARAVVFESIPAGFKAVGNPAVWRE